jgi:DNA-binding PadR family transcriptional regulator
MSTRHQVLGMLLDGPAHPYQVADRLKKRLGPAWEINTGNLSNMIRSLEEDGLIRFVGFDERDRRRKVFEITTDGVVEIGRWWHDRGVPDTQAFRETLLLKVALAGPNALEDTLALCKACERDCLRRINEVAERRSQIAATEGPRTLADDVVLRLSLSADIYVLEGNLKLAQHAQRVIRWMLSEAAVWPGTRTVLVSYSDTAMPASPQPTGSSGLSFGEEPDELR